MATSITTSGEIPQGKNPRPVPVTNWSVRSWADSINLQWTGLQERMVVVEGIRDGQSHHSGDGKYLFFLLFFLSHRLPNPKSKGIRFDSSDRTHLSIVGNDHGSNPGRPVNTTKQDLSSRDQRQKQQRRKDTADK